MININTFIGGFIGCLLVEIVALVIYSIHKTRKDNNAKVARQVLREMNKRK